MRNLLVVILLFSTLACTKDGFKAKLFSTPQASAGFTVNLPDSDKLDPNCMTNSDFDACIFNKNPIYHQGPALTNQTRAQLSSLLTLGVKITDLDSSGFLQNSTFRVETLRSSRLPAGDLAQLKKTISESSTDSNVEQLMTYYYTNFAVKYLASRGPLAVQGRNVRILVDDRLNGWRRDTNTIHLSRGSGRNAAAFDASQVVYLLAQANLDWANGGAVSALTTGQSNHRSCGADRYGCCVNANGCSRAIASGVSAYTVAMIFPQQPVVGELSANRINGVRLCSVLDRDIRGHVSLRASDTYSMCADRNGDINVMGSLYASIWWQIRGQAELMSPDSGAKDIDRLFLSHLPQISATDTFASSRDKMVLLDGTLFSGRYTSLIQAEFQRRGI